MTNDSGDDYNKNVGDIMPLLNRIDLDERTKGILEKNNVFEGIKVTAILPEKQLKSSSRKSATTRGLATLGFGIVGLAATSGVSQNEENREIDTIFQIVDKGIVLKNGKMDGSDLRISYNQIIKMEVIDVKNKEIFGLITLTGNRRLLITRRLNKEILSIIFNYISDIINEKAKGIYFEEPGWGLDSKKEYDGDCEELINSLERISDLYNQDLLSKDEYDLIKNKLIRNLKSTVFKSKERTCSSCGENIEQDMIFCPECGKKI